MSTTMHMPVRLKPPTDAGEIILPRCAVLDASPTSPERDGMPIAVIGTGGIGGPCGAALVVDAAERLTPILGDEAMMGGMAFVTGTIAFASPDTLLLPCEIPQPQSQRQPWGDRHVCGQE
jgi:hypothetical protein